MEAIFTRSRRKPGLQDEFFLEIAAVFLSWEIKMNELVTDSLENNSVLSWNHFLKPLTSAGGKKYSSCSFPAANNFLQSVDESPDIAQENPKKKTSKNNRIKKIKKRNKFEVLSFIDPESLLVDSGRKQRIVSLGVDKIFQDLKLKKKEHVSNVKKLEESGETRVKEDKTNTILKQSFGDWDSCCNYNQAVNGRIWVLWLKSLNCTVYSIFDQCVSIRAIVGGKVLYISAIYGSNDGVLRRQLWNQLCLMENSVGSDPWLIEGDFNVILNLEESSAPVSATLMSDISEFQNCVEGLGLSDHSYIDPLFTWSNKQHDSFLARKLDRVLTTSGWYESFTDSEVEFLAPGDLDHFPAFVWLHKHAPTARPKSFKFFNFWALHPRFLQTVKDSWQTPIDDNPTQVLFLKLKKLKCGLKDLNKFYFNDISSRVMQKCEELSKIQLTNLNSGTAGIYANSKCEVERELKILEEAELLFYKQKAKTNWIKEGDQGTHFFHSMVAVGERAIPSECSLIRMVEDCNLLKTCLVRAVFDEEIKEALWGQGNDKSPGPDGYNPCFFKKAWSIVGEDFKVVIRILVNRMSAVFPGMITNNQTAFVKGRSIVDNTLFAQEIVRGYAGKNNSPRCALKIDLQKAFDSLS
ncbi:uncharacterized protein LOC120125471 [Hibiscus syriacus]|uniref:uncharacterized protein LOC120125471 n=1 Tax=Hibiscus syriacus TaxID=106335 RepID=UPI001923BD34|nr:uncharacterized protein LOC120125471 [Hibiscus syriacus]